LSESDDGDKSISKRKPTMRKSVETINLIDDESDEENKIKNFERYIVASDEFFIIKILIINLLIFFFFLIV
jgi:uncharacterized protein with von Willebrand factor type A (vWA) domain